MQSEYTKIEIQVGNEQIQAQLARFDNNQREDFEACQKYIADLLESGENKYVARLAALRMAMVEEIQPKT